ncbi:hypothetical protein [Actinoplanes lobatus]|uniref:Phenylalanyl-tRNA synthetase beta subunit n=1 Tax=Actinoplanes lobatus TaxID=113568 RepID=A0A7W7MJF0_9ACTN|nr:hypothetical protein [Actinoplanes lobatus]MBB4752388.1 phenylalanyl-tRNA synthetase beta subunit [Actinoplanes lobatus]
MVVTGWISEVQNQRRRASEVLNAPRPQRTARMSPDQIADMVGQLGDIVTVLDEADPEDLAEIYRQLGLRPTYHPEMQKVRVRAQPVADSHGKPLVSEAQHSA